MNILFIGDIYGRPGRTIVKKKLPELVEKHKVDLVLANGENAAGGFGITPSLVEELLELGIAALSSGNHIWDRKEILPFLRDHNASARLIRPANYPPGSPGKGLFLGETDGGVRYALTNLQGRVFMANTDCPFRTADALLTELPKETKLIFVDFHAEATSEKQALGWYLDGRVTAVLGTHTHIPTADAKVLPGGTAYMTDLGMSGPYDSVIGIEKQPIIEKFIRQIPSRFEAAQGDVRLCGVLMEADPTSGRALSIRRIEEREE